MKMVLRSGKKLLEEQAANQSSTDRNISYLLNAIPPQFHHPTSSKRRFVWLAAFIYLHHLTGASTDITFGVTSGDAPSEIEAKQMLWDLICSIRGDPVNTLPPKEKDLATAAKNRIRRRLRMISKKKKQGQVENPVPKDFTPGNQDSSAESAAITALDEENLPEDAPMTGFVGNDILQGTDQIVSVLTAADYLAAQIFKHKKFPVDVDNSAQIIALSEEMIQELRTGANDVAKFGARGDGDFEKLAWAVYNLRCYFFDKVEDDSNIVNLFCLVDLAVKLVKSMVDALRTVKACFNDADTPQVPTATYNGEEVPNLPTADTQQTTSSSSSSRPLNSFAFCSLLKLSQASASTSSG